MERDKTEYSNHVLAEVVNVENKNDWILVTRYRIGKWKYYQYLQDNNVRKDNR